MFETYYLIYTLSCKPHMYSTYMRMLFHLCDYNYSYRPKNLPS